MDNKILSITIVTTLILVGLVFSTILEEIVGEELIRNMMFAGAIICIVYLFNKVSDLENELKSCRYKNEDLIIRTDKLREDVQKLSSKLSHDPFEL